MFSRKAPWINFSQLRADRPLVPVERGGGQVQPMEQALIVLGRFQDDLGQAGVVHFPQIAPDKTKRRFSVQLVLGLRIIGRQSCRHEMPAEAEIRERAAGAFASELFPASGQYAALIFRARHDREHALCLEADDGHPTGVEILFATGERPLIHELMELVDIETGTVFCGHDTFHAPSGYAQLLPSRICKYAARGAKCLPPAILAYVSGPARLRG